MEGWIKLHRRFSKWEWYQDSAMKNIFIHLLTHANHKPGKWRGHKIGRGQLITGRKKLSQDTGLSEQNIRTCLSKLEKTGEINQQSNQQYTLITLCNYDTYQVDVENTNQQSNQQLTNNQPTTNQQLTTNKNNKELKNDNNERIKMFETFWNEYHFITRKPKTDKEATLKY